MHDIIADIGMVLKKVSAKYCKISNIRRTKSQSLNDHHLVLQLSLPNP